MLSQNILHSPAARHRFGLPALLNEKRYNGDDDQWHAGDTEPHPRANIPSPGRSRIVPQGVRLHLSRRGVCSAKAAHQPIPRGTSPRYISADYPDLDRLCKGRMATGRDAEGSTSPSISGHYGAHPLRTCASSHFVGDSLRVSLHVRFIRHKHFLASVALLEGRIRNQRDCFDITR